MKNNKILVQNTEVSIKQHEKIDFISLTDIARYKDKERSDYILQNWMRNRETIEFLGLWEKINNDNFNSIEFDGIKMQAGRYGGTYAHKDIAFEFASWISAEFKLFLIKEFQRLKEDEIQNKSLEWDLSRSLSKINYKIHTDAIKEHLLPRTINKPKESFIYPNEAQKIVVLAILSFSYHTKRISASTVS